MGLHQVVMVTLLLGHWLPDTGFLTLTLVGCDGRCVWYPYSAVTSLGLEGYLWLGVGRCCHFLGSVQNVYGCMGFYWFDL